MEVKFDLKKAVGALENANHKIESAIERATKRVAMVAEHTMRKQIIGGHRPGTTRVQGRGIVAGHPSRVTGYLSQSIHTKYKKGFGSYSAIVGPGASYARTLEEGSPNWRSGVRYPIVEPTAKIMSADGRSRQIYFDELRKALGK